MKSLFLAWRAPNRMWFPVGRLDADVAREHYVFGYTNGALQAKAEVGFNALPAFPDLNSRYESADLFPLFQNRVMNPNRKNFGDYLASLGLTRGDPIEILSVTGVERQTDSFEVFPKIDAAEDGSFTSRFFIRGMRHLAAASQARAFALKSGEELGVSVELSDSVTQLGIMLSTRTDCQCAGWAPRYLVTDLLSATAERPQVTAKVIRVNPDDVPANRRVLVEFGGTLPEAVQPMSGKAFQLITPTPREH
jgi:hypothetical protein